MSSLQALLVVGIIAPIAALTIWWLFFRMDSSPAPEVPDEPIERLSADDVQMIETTLGVTLPADYALFLQADRPGPIDNTTVRDDPELIIGFTQDYRRDSGWPPHFIWVGDEADGCPYTLDCMTGAIFRLEKGNVKKMWDRFPSFSEFVQAQSTIKANE
jgi:hypothetical protein